MRVLYLAVMLSIPSALLAQGARFNGLVVNSNGHPVPGAAITVCTFSATGVPCSPTVSIYSDIALAVAKTNPTTSDSNGNFGFYVLPGVYTFTVTGTGVSATGPFVVSVPVGASSSGTSVLGDSYSGSWFYLNNPAQGDVTTIRKTWRNTATSGGYTGIRSEVTAASGGSFSGTQPIYSPFIGGGIMQAKGQLTGGFFSGKGYGAGNNLGWGGVLECFGGTTSAAGNAEPQCTGFGELDMRHGSYTPGGSIFRATVSGNQSQGQMVIPFTAATNSSVLGQRPVMNLSRKTTAGNVTGIAGNQLTFASAPVWDASASPCDNTSAGTHCNPVGEYIKLNSTEELYSPPCIGDDVQFDSLCVGHWFLVTSVASSTVLQIEQNFSQGLGNSGAPAYILVEGGEIQSFSTANATITIPSNSYIWQNGDQLMSAPYHLMDFLGINLIFTHIFKSGGPGAPSVGGYFSNIGSSPMDYGIQLNGLPTGAFKTGFALSAIPNVPGAVGLDLSPPDWRTSSGSAAIKTGNGQVVVGGIVPSAAGSYASGSSSLPWTGIFIGNGPNASVQITGTFSANRTATIPDATDTLVGRVTTDTLSNKTLDTMPCGQPPCGDVLRISGSAITSGVFNTVRAFCTGTVDASSTDYLNGNACSAASVGNARYVIALGGTLSKLQVSVGTAVKLGGSAVTATVLKNGVATALTCSLLPGTTTCSNTADAVSVVAGDVVTFSFGPTNAGETAADIGMAVAEF